MHRHLIDQFSIDETTQENIEENTYFILLLIFFQYEKVIRKVETVAIVNVSNLFLIFSINAT